MQALNIDDNNKNSHRSVKFKGQYLPPAYAGMAEQNGDDFLALSIQFKRS